MFGWRFVGKDDEHSRRYGLKLELLRSGQWLAVFWGRHTWNFTRYTLARHTGPEDNRSVLRHFFSGIERRRKNRGYRAGFAEAAQKPPVERTRTRIDSY